jgi:tRNA dimethylallyltransferase
MPLPELLLELERSDPPAFERIDVKNRRRVVRAIEVIRLTGRRFSEQRATWSPPGRSPGSARVLALDRDPAELRARIDARVDWMFEKGLVRETEGLLARGLEHNRVAMQAIGYRQVVEQLRNGRSEEQTVALVKQRTAQFARRQRTWLRHQLPVEWIVVGPTDDADRVAARIQEKLGLG